LIKLLHKYFFTPASLKELGIIRIVIVGIQLFFLLNILGGIASNPGSNLDFQNWLTSIEANEFNPTLINTITLLPINGGERPGYELMQVIWWVSLIAAFCAFFGLFTNISLAFLAYGSTILISHFYSYQEYHHTETVLVIFLWILTFSRCGYVYSLDYLLRKKRSEIIKKENFYNIYARWPVRTMQWIFVIVYFSAGFEKITSGVDWMNGYTLAYGIVQDCLQRDISLGIWVSSNIGLMVLFSLTAVLFETFFFIIMIFPRLTWIFLLMGAAFHTSVYILHGPPFIHYIILYIVFLEPLRMAINNIKFFKLRLKTAM
jgi:hypothetical protein